MELLAGIIMLASLILNVFYISQRSEIHNLREAKDNLKSELSDYKEKYNKISSSVYTDGVIDTTDSIIIALTVPKVIHWCNGKTNLKFVKKWEYMSEAINGITKDVLGVIESDNIDFEKLLLNEDGLSDFLITRIHNVIEATFDQQLELAKASQE